MKLNEWSYEVPSCVQIKGRVRTTDKAVSAIRPRTTPLGAEDFRFLNTVVFEEASESEKSKKIGTCFEHTHETPASR